MRFINREEGNWNRLQCRIETAAAKAFGCDVNEFVFAAAQGVDASALLGFGDRAVDESGRQIASTECVHLIFHEGDQWRHDECDSVEDHRGQLITERLTAAGRHYDDRIFAFENRSNHLALAFTKVLEAKVLLERSDCIRERVHARV